MFVAHVTVPSVPAAVVHQMIWGLYDLPPGTDRPYLYRHLDGDRYVVLSRLRPRCPHRQVAIEAGQTLAFDVVACAEKWVGDRRNGIKQPLTANSDLKAWIARRMDGGRVMFVQVYDRRDEQMQHTRHGRIGWTCHRFVGQVYVEDRAAFCRSVLQGAGRGKVAGLGMIYLPEVMSDATTDRARTSA